jgi:hypothetical protein
MSAFDPKRTSGSRSESSGHAFRHHRLESSHGSTSGPVWILRFKVVIEHFQADRAGVALSAQRLEDGVARGGDTIAAPLVAQWRRLHQNVEPSLETQCPLSGEKRTSCGATASHRLGTTRTRTDAHGSHAIRNGRSQESAPQLRRRKRRS